MLKNIAIWGTGRGGTKAYFFLKNKYKITCFIDNAANQVGHKLYDIPIHKLSPEKKEFIVIASVYWKEIAIQLRDCGYILGKDFMPYCFMEKNTMDFSAIADLVTPSNIGMVIDYIRKNFDKKIAVVYGNCQTIVLRKILLCNREFANKYILLEIPTVCEYLEKRKNYLDVLVDKDTSLISNIDLLIYQHVKKENRFAEKLATDNIISRLNKECIAVQIVNIYFNAYFLQAERNKHKIGKELHVSGLFPYADKYVDDYYKTGMKADEILKIIKNQDFITEAEIKYSVSESLWQLKKREKTADVKISDYIAENYDKVQLFYSPNHPCNKLLLEYANRIIKYLGFERTPIDETNVYIVSGCLKGQDIPIYPAVINTLKLPIYERTFYPNRYLDSRLLFDFDSYILNYIESLSTYY